MSRASASRSALLFACGHWVHAAPTPEPPVDHAARRGLALHRLAEQMLRRELTSDSVHRWAKHFDVDPTALAESWAPLERWLLDIRPRFEPEVAVAVDLDTGAGRRLPDVRNRSYGTMAAHEIPGTIDFFLVDHERRSAIVLDLKTGDPEHVEPVATNTQLLTLALAVARIYELARVTVGLVFLHGKEGVVSEERHTHDLFALDAHAARLRRAITLAESAAPVLAPHCETCPHRFACSARTELVRKEDPLLVEAASQGVQSTEDVRRLYRRLVVLEDACERVRTDVRRIVEAERVVDLGDGHELRTMQVKGRTSIDAKALWALAEDHGASERELNECVRVGRPSTRLVEKARPAA